MQLDGNVKHINRGKVGAPKVKPRLEEQHVERQYDQRADERFLSEWQGDLDLDCVAATGVPQVHLAARHVCGEVGARSAG